MTDLGIEKKSIFDEGHLCLGLITFTWPAKDDGYSFPGRYGIEMFWDMVIINYIKRKSWKLDIRRDKHKMGKKVRYRWVLIFLGPFFLEFYWKY